MGLNSACAQNCTASHDGGWLGSQTRLQLHLSVVQGYAQAGVAGSLEHVVHDVACSLREKHRVFMNDQNGIPGPGLCDDRSWGPVPDGVLQRLPYRNLGSRVHQATELMHITLEHAEAVRACRARDTFHFAPGPAVAHDVDAVDAR